MKLLLNRYHPIVDDLAQSFYNHLGYDVTVCIDTSIFDHYGSHEDILAAKKLENTGVEYINTRQAALFLTQKDYDLVGVDGVYSFDKELMAIADKVGVPHFSICGYPHSFDEPSKNILSFSWFLPQMQYRKAYPHEGYIKELDWKNLAEDKTPGKNVFVFYPEMSDVKKKLIKSSVGRSGGISLIHRFEECNKWSYEVFKYVNSKLDYPIVNYSNLTRNEVWNKLLDANLFVHLKSADCPGISLLEAMLLGTVPVVMKNFVLASQNQEVLINNYSAFVCETKDEAAEIVQKNYFTLENPELRLNTYKHVSMLTDFNRQRAGLVNFFARCLEK